MCCAISISVIFWRSELTYLTSGCIGEPGLWSHSRNCSCSLYGRKCWSCGVWVQWLAKSGQGNAWEVDVPARATEICRVFMTFVGQMSCQWHWHRLLTWREMVAFPAGNSPGAFTICRQGHGAVKLRAVHGCAMLLEQGCSWSDCIRGRKQMPQIWWSEKCSSSYGPSLLLISSRNECDQCHFFVT